MQRYFRWEGFWDSINPSLICRRYKVSCSGYFGGHNYVFWRYGAAKRFYDKQVENNSSCFIDLYDTYYSETPKNEPAMSPGYFVAQQPMRLFTYKDKTASTPVVTMDETGRINWNVRSQDQYNRSLK